MVVSVTAGDPFVLAILVKLFDRVGTGGVKQPEPRSGTADIGDNQRFGYEIGQPVYRLARCVCCIDGHGCRSLDRKAAGEDAERPEELLLVLAQQAVAPIEDGPHGSMPRRCCATPRPQQRQAAIQAGDKAFDPKHLDARRGKLDRQRQAVKPAANLADQRRVCIGQREVLDNRADALDKQLNGGKSRRLGCHQPR